MLALLLKMLSGSIEFRDVGNKLCKTFLQDSHIQLFDKGLSAGQAKEHLVSPCLRLLTEIVSFDGGRATKLLFRQREITFKRLEVFLGMRNDAYRSASEKKKKPSIRNNALRYLLMNLRLQNPAAKINILRQRQVMRAIFEHISEDPPATILELLDVLKQHVASDSAIPLHVKGRIFNERLLSRLSTLYYYEETESLTQKRTSVQHSAHKFLLFLCTSPACGVLGPREQAFLDNEDNESRNSHLVSYEHPRHRNSQEGYVPGGRNPELLSFLQNLRPHANVMQSELILAVFQISPELMSDYFARGKSYSLEPKATVTWVGYSSFLLAAMRLPLPESLLDLKSKEETPDKFNTVLNTVIPLPITQKIMTRCLNQNVNLIKALATKIVTAAFERFAKVLPRRISALESRPNTIKWHQNASKLTTEFCNRIPEIEHVIAQYRNCTRDNVFLKESLSRLLTLYYANIPQVALETRLDVSVTLSTMLQRSAEKVGIQLLEQDHLIQIAHHSPSMQWWHKSGVSSAFL